ncbi:MAG: entericidin [Gemmatimonadales bacterium]
MSKFLVVAAVLAVAACGEKTGDAPPADTTAVVPATPDTMPRDTTDTTKVARDTTKAP